jgi:hypothetical protein
MTWSLNDGVFRVTRPVESHSIGGVPHLTRDELGKPSCPACYRPGREQGYCQNCRDTGSAIRHAAHRRRGL